VASSIQAEGLAVQAILKAIDPANQSITLRLTTKGEPEVERTYRLAEKAQFTVDGADRKLADLPKDVPVRVRLSAKGTDVLSIQVESANVIGVVKVVDAGNRSLVLADKQGEKLLTVAKDAPVFVDDKPATLADVPEGASVTVRVSADHKLVRSLTAQGKSVSAVVATVDEVNREITVTLPKDGDAKFKMAEDVKVLIGGESKDGKTVPKAGKLSDVKPDLRVSLVLAADQKSVSRIVVMEK